MQKNNFFFSQTLKITNKTTSEQKQSQFIILIKIKWITTLFSIFIEFKFMDKQINSNFM